MDDKVKLSMSRKPVFETADIEEIKDIYEYNKRYMAFLDKSKTERLFSKNAVEEAKKLGFRSLEECEKLEAGDKVYAQINNKALVLFVLGKDDIQKGMNIVAVHIDSPRLDLKPLPLYEKNNLAFFKTHYYGGIKKYQWVTTPLALYGTVVKKDGKKINVAIGDKENEPVFCVTDLLVHLAAVQMRKRASEVIEGEDLTLLAGSIPLIDKSEAEDKDKDADKGKSKEPKVKFKVKENILKILNYKYGFTEGDFESAEFEAVPAGKARNVGIDESLVGSYAQDDRVCAYAALEAISSIEGVPERSMCVIFADKEEIGSYGNTGLQSRLFENTMVEILNLINPTGLELALRRALKNSNCLSGDVTSGFDPTYASAFDGGNVAYIGNGVALNKYGGSRGKSGSNDAHPEYLAKLRACFDDNKVAWQTGELGKVDQGGGGTVAFMLANYGMQVVDCGTPVLSMHSPFEVTSKADTYMTFKAYKAFLGTF